MLTDNDKFLSADDWF
jgi:hypothetical protein